MSVGKLVLGLKNSSDSDILNMNADWTSKWYPFGKFKDLSVQLKWSNISLLGTLYLDYSCDPNGSIFSTKNVLDVDGTFDEALFLDAALAINNYRLRFVHSSGTATVVAFHNYKAAGE